MMALDHYFPTYGIITSSGSPINNANVYIQDTTVGSSILNMTTGADGKYIINIESIANDGDTIKVWSFGNNGQYEENSSVLDISGAAKNVDLALTDNTIADTAKANDSLVSSASIPLADNPKAVDGLVSSASIPLADNPKANDSLVSSASIPLSDNPKAGDSLVVHPNIPLSDNPKAADSLVVSASISLSDIAKAVDSFVRNASIALSDTAKARDVFSSDAMGKKFKAVLQNLTKLVGKYTPQDEKVP